MVRMNVFHKLRVHLAVDRPHPQCPTGSDMFHCGAYARIARTHNRRRKNEEVPMVSSICRIHICAIALERRVNDTMWTHHLISVGRDTAILLFQIQMRCRLLFQHQQIPWNRRLKSSITEVTVTLKLSFDARDHFRRPINFYELFSTTTCDHGQNTVTLVYIAISDVSRGYSPYSQEFRLLC
jgi:hypothetical protein